MDNVAHNLPEGRPEFSGASAELLPLIYGELRRLAAARLAREKPGQTLQATALVHEAWLRLENTDNSKQHRWQNQAHFFAAAADAMRGILVENARRKLALKRGNGAEKVDLEFAQIAAPLPDDQILAVDEALEELAREDPQAAQLVQLRYFVGLTHQEAAEALGLNRTAADRTWVFARAWLGQRLGPGTKS